VGRKNNVYQKAISTKNKRGIETSHSRLLAGGSIKKEVNQMIALE
jgi:hypothetical protein